MPDVSGYPSRPNFASAKVGGESLRAILSAVKSADTSRSSTTVLAADPDLTLPLVYPARYLILGYLNFKEGAGASSGGIKYSLNYTGGVGGQIYGRSSSVLKGGGGTAIDLPYDLAFPGSAVVSGARSVTAGTNDLTHLRLEFAFLTAPAAGNIELQWAQAASSIQATKLSNGLPAVMWNAPHAWPCSPPLPAWWPRWWRNAPAHVQAGTLRTAAACWKKSP